jgi:hypothetical protein
LEDLVGFSGILKKFADMKGDVNNKFAAEEQTVKANLTSLQNQ